MDTVDLLKQLEINYKLMGSDLEFSSHALDSLLKAAARADSSLPDLHALPSRIGALRKAIGALAIDAAQVVREGKDAEPGLTSAMLENYTVMVGLYSRLGVAPDPDWVAVADEVKHLVPGESLRSGGSVPGRSVRSGVEEGVEGLAEEASHHCDTASPSKPGRKAGRMEDKRCTPSPTEISEQDFLAVPSTTRGRARLQDVRKGVYAKVLEDFEEKSSRDRIGNARHGFKPKAISKKELGAAGLKVFGLTGDCTLNTLRAMGLITVTKTGVTLSSSSA
ncbi:unnamed protein product [Ascophyllum nodosum]